MIVLDILSDRVENLRLALLGYQQTGVDLVAQAAPGHLKAAGFSDDVGIYYWIPKIATVFHLSLNQATFMFFFGMIFLGWLIGSLAVFFLFQHPLAKIIALIGLLELARVTYDTWDVYTVAGTLVMALVPLTLLLVKRRKIDRWFILFAIIAGLAIGTGQYIRSQSGTAVLLFILIMIWVGLRTQNFRSRLGATASLLLGISIPVLMMTSLIHRRDRYLQAHEPGYTPVIAHHDFWHPVYLGFGFLSNTKGLAWDDRVAANAVKRIDPHAGYLTDRYNQILKNEVIHLYHSDPQFFWYTIFAKLGIMFYYLLVYANIGLIFALFYRKPWPVELAFWTGLAFSALFGILVFPSPAYSLGFIALAMLYGIVSLTTSLEHGFLTTVSRWFSRKQGR